MTSQDIAVAIGKQLSGKGIICPLCLSNGELEQEMFPVGDQEDVLMCPHCDMQVNLVIYRQRVYVGDVLESNVDNA
jgi:hypothetical protein